ncbi:putative NAD-dependent epimerase/dehydratase [Actinacidiphila reveromycinica]|uniref:Putative NAD-dependent epimerase/dehydratase n=1 Tax=Actinacidiphila reveromycinica TaxID=659352 RepID=A0A7U3UNU3_9ACTN|nr:NAD(P)-dependent oxidoreductase [Streptomyces sp. SN-593]BBA95958.1 putative NAD-dependent epimerase/dehydratase [Streptomyces sp. SN-593]
MRILVTGATGQVGRRFVPRLMQRAGRGDDTVRVLVRDEARAEPFTRLGAEAVVGELRDGADVRRAVEGVDAVVNVAASFRGVPDEEVWAVNRDAALDLGRAAVEAGARRFVQVSTNRVYGAGRGRPALEDDGPLAGNSRLPGTAYPDSKWAAETGLLALDGLDLRIGRLAFVYGEGDPHLDNALPWAKAWPGHQRLQMVHHADVGQALLRLLYVPGLAGRIYNIADDAPVTSVDLLWLGGVEPSPEAADRVVTDPWDGVVSTARIRDELGFRPIYPSVWTARDAGAL